MDQQAIIRQIKREDLSELVHLCHLHAIYEECDYSAEGKEQLLQQHFFNTPPSLMGLVVELNQQLIGYATFMEQFSTWDATHYIYLDCLFIMEEHRGKNLGELLVSKIKEEARKKGCSLIQWQTPDFNTRAIKFYKRIGATCKSKERFFLSTHS